jgi:hypothetical protein
MGLGLLMAVIFGLFGWTQILSCRRVYGWARILCAISCEEPPLTGFEFRQIQMKATELSFQDGTLVQDHRTG